ncbi:MAG: proprotein convertase P-domain-containing protein [Deltaproteobacteria bacterium]|nr:proprotein convertase P-domain-containing protein [Deltaproteobacteria bacterium]
MRSWRLLGLGLMALMVGACSSGTDETQPTETEDPGVNPFLEDQSGQGKSDTAYLNPDGREVEVDLEADIEASSYQLKEGPADLGQFALTYLRKRGEFYLESLAEDATSSSRVEWLENGSWVTYAQATAKDKLKHWRIRGVNAVLLNSAATGVKEGTEFTAKVPVRPYAVMQEAGETCGEVGGHISLSQSVYWYLWDPDKEGCKVAMQDLKVTVSKILPSAKTVYPEFDKLVADGRVTAVVLFGQIGDGAITDSDPGMRGFRQMGTWLKQSGFKEATAPLGKRFVKKIGQVDFEIDLYSPYEFSGLSDYSHFNNFQKALSEHEIVAYDGHSMLGASDFWSKPEYPKFYQIFLYGGCLGYEYYVKPILDGKGGWENLDLMSSVVEVSAGANEFAGPVLAKIAWALDHGYQAPWRDLLVGVRQRVGDSTFGVSGVRDNCFSPGGSLCGPQPDPGTSSKYESTTAVDIPDNKPEGVTSTIEVSDSLTAKTVTLDLNVTHTWVGDLQITLQHGDASAVVWDKAGGSKRDIQQSITLSQFADKDIKGTWTLKVVDTAAQDSGKLNSWAITVTK